MEKKLHHIEVLKNEFSKRREVNASYSLRSFSKFLGLQPPVLSTVLNYKRKLSLSHAERISDLLHMNEENRSLFLNSTIQAKLNRNQEVLNNVYNSFSLNQQKHFNVIADWKYFTILNLVDLNDTIHTYSYIANRIGIKEFEAKTVITELIELELLDTNESGEWVRTKGSLKTPDDILSFALQMSHRNDLKKASRMLEKVEIFKRDYSSVTFKCNTEKMAEIKIAIREFRDKVSSIAEDGNEDEVYQMSLQLFPLTESE